MTLVFFPVFFSSFLFFVLLSRFVFVSFVSCPSRFSRVSRRFFLPSFLFFGFLFFFAFFSFSCCSPFFRSLVSFSLFLLLSICSFGVCSVFMTLVFFPVFFSSVFCH